MSRLRGFVIFAITVQAETDAQCVHKLRVFSPVCRRTFVNTTIGRRHVRLCDYLRPSAPLDELHGINHIFHLRNLLLLGSKTHSEPESNRLAIVRTMPSRRKAAKRPTGCRTLLPLNLLRLGRVTVHAAAVWGRRAGLVRPAKATGLGRAPESNRSREGRQPPPLLPQRPGLRRVCPVRPADPAGEVRLYIAKSIRVPKMLPGPGSLLFVVWIF